MKTGAGQTKSRKRMRGAYCKKDLANLYGITYKSLSAWLRPMASEIGPLHGYYFTRAQVEIIFETLGYPEK
ncbi:MAG: hypothetical protein ABIN36_09980 [Ferruginibacter sp.]